MAQSLFDLISKNGLLGVVKKVNIIFWIWLDLYKGLICNVFCSILLVNNCKYLLFFSNFQLFLILPKTDKFKLLQNTS